MKRSQAANKKVCVIFMGLALLISSLSLAAQSGRIIPNPPPPTPPAKSPAEPEAKPKFTPDPNAPKYKLVFDTHWSDRFTYEPAKVKRENRPRYSKHANFLEELNKLGEQGYRLETATMTNPLMGIVKLTETQYEYTWFETSSIGPFEKDGFTVLSTPLLQQGFSIVDHFYMDKLCVSNGTSDEIETIFSKDCDYRDIFLLEREKGNTRPVQISMARHFPSWKAFTGDDVLTAQLDEFLARGFYPQFVLSRFQILLGRTTRIEDLKTDGVELKVVTKGIEKKVNALAKQGYRLALTDYDIAVMYRLKGQTSPASYVWLSGVGKKFDQTFLQLQEKGAIYRTTYPTDFGNEYTFVFEQPASNDGARCEYKVLKFDLESIEHKAQNSFDFKLTEVSKENEKLLNNLSKEGFVVRDVIRNGWASSLVLLERVK